MCVLSIDENVLSMEKSFQIVFFDTENKEVLFLRNNPQVHFLSI